MPLLQRLALFSFIVFFSGSVVVVAARNLHSKLAPHTDQDKEHAQKLIEALRGDALFKAQAKYSETHPAPSRSNGSYLPDHDRRRIKSFLSSLIGGKDAGSDDPGQQSEKIAADPKQGEK
jgi:hypothetical protein